MSFARREVTRDIHAGDIAVVGVPFDLGATYRPGARLGPRAIREQSVFTSGFSSKIWPWMVDLSKTQRIVDYGDIHYPAGSLDGMVDCVSDEIQKIASLGARPLVLGGDHVISYPVLNGLAEIYGPLSLIHIDAHYDTWPNEEGLEHGSVFLQAAQDGLVDPSRSVQIGMRTYPSDVGYLVIDGEEFLTSPIESTLQKIRERVGTSPSYVTFDIDFLDPAYAPGTGTPVIGGPTTRDARRLLFALKGLPVVGADLTEVSPPYDPTAITAIAGATLAMDLAHVLHFSSFDTSANETLTEMRSGESRRAYRDRFGEQSSRRNKRSTPNDASHKN